MRVTIDHHTFYDWEPLPAGLEPDEKDIKKQIVKPSANGGWLMRVDRACPDGESTHTRVDLPEHQLIEQIIQDWVKLKLLNTRTEAIGHYLARHVTVHHAHRSWMQDVHVELDEGPNVALFTQMLAEQVAAGNIEELDVDALAEAYCAHTVEETFVHPHDEEKKPQTRFRTHDGHHKKHLTKHFGIRPKVHAPKPEGAK